MKKIVSILSFICLVISISFSTAFAGDVEATVQSFTENDDGIICIAHRGDWHSFPENSLEAVKTAETYDAVSIDLKITKDNKIVLFADDTLDRMCTDSNGLTTCGYICDYTYEQLSKLRLRRNNGSTQNPMTTCTIPLFSDVYNEVKGKTTLVLNIALDDFDAVYAEVKSLNAQKDVVFRIDGTSKEIVEKYNSTDKDITVLGNYQGNIIFMATSAVKRCANAGINTIEMGSTNGHGVLYDTFLMKRFGGKLRAMASMVNGRCGKRADNETGWDDLISRGYSVIETNYPQELTDYIIETKSAKNTLSVLVDRYESTDLSPYTTDTENNFTVSLENAKSVLSVASSLSEIDDARYTLQSAYDSLTVGEKKAVSLSFKFSIGKTITVVLCLLAFVGSQIYLFKKREKQGV